MKGNTPRVLFWSGLLVLMSATFLAGCGQGPDQKTESPIPDSAAGERFVTEGASNLIEAKISTTMSIGIRVLMIGDNADLQSIDDEEMDRIAVLVKEVIKNSAFSLRAEKDNFEIRNTLCNDINSTLNQSIVNEVRFSRFTIGEYRPVLQ